MAYQYGSPGKAPTPVPAKETMAEDGDMHEGMNEGMHDESSPTAELPLNMFAGKSVKEGDVFEFKVVGVDQEGGNATIVYNTDPEPGEEGGGSDEMAAEFDKPMTKGQI